MCIRDRFRVVKNTLTIIAARDIGLGDLEQYLEGPTAIAFAYEDPAEVARIINDFTREFRELGIKGGTLLGREMCIRDSYDREQLYSPSEAIDLVKATAKAGFDETVELAVKLGIDPKRSDQQVRGAVVLPHGTGKSVRVAVFAKGEKAKEAEEAGADFVGAEELAEKVQGLSLIHI